MNIRTFFASLADTWVDGIAQETSCRVYARYTNQFVGRNGVWGCTIWAISVAHVSVEPTLFVNRVARSAIGRSDAAGLTWTLAWDTNSVDIDISVVAVRHASSFEQNWELACAIAESAVLGIAFAIETRQVTSCTDFVYARHLIVSNTATWQADRLAHHFEWIVIGTVYAVRDIHVRAR